MSLPQENRQRSATAAAKQMMEASDNKVISGFCLATVSKFYLELLHKSFWCEWPFSDLKHFMGSLLKMHIFI